MSRSEGWKCGVFAVWGLFSREVLRFVRQRNRVIGALATPLVFWVALGSGFGTSFRPPGLAAGMDYLTYFFPGTILLVVLFTAIFSSISIIQDRNEGFLQGVLVSPAPRICIVLGKVLGGATVGFLQGLLMLVLAPLAGIGLNPISVLAAAGVLLLTAIALSSLGFLLAWRMDSVQGFHAIMNLLLIPMWLMSGAFFPEAGASGWMKVVMWINPLRYGLAALRRVLHGNAALQAELGAPALAPAVIVIACFAALSLMIAVWIARKPLE